MKDTCARLWLLLALLPACGQGPYEQTLAALAEGDLRSAGSSAQQVPDPVGVFLRGSVAFAECLRAERQAESAAAEPFAFDVAIALAEKAETRWREAAMARDDWPAARRNVERAQAKAAELRRKREEAQDRLKPPPQPKPKPQPKPEPKDDGGKRVTEDDPGADPMLRELPPEEVRRLVERLAEKEAEKRGVRAKERRRTAGARDW